LHIFLKSIVNLFVRSWYFLLKNCFFLGLASLSVVLFMYTYTKPVLEAMFSYMGIDLSLLNSFEELEISKEQIDQFFKEKEILEKKIQFLETEVARNKAEKEGLLAGIKAIKLANLPWGKIVFYSLVTSAVLGVLIYYFGKSGGDAGFFRPILDSIHDNNEQALNFLTKQFNEIEKRDKLLVHAINDLKMDLAILNNLLQNYIK